MWPKFSNFGLISVFGFWPTIPKRNSGRKLKFRPKLFGQHYEFCVNTKIYRQNYKSRDSAKSLTTRKECYTRKFYACDKILCYTSVTQNS